jgi:aminoglycoside phosphotransferase (APT) family kinase protein
MTTEPTAQTVESPPEVAPVRPGEELDWDSLAAYLTANIPDLDGDMQVLQFPNGSANLTYFVQFGDQRLVVRRPPFGAIAPGAHDMRREHRILSTLWRSFDRAPRSFLFCDDHGVIGSDFLVIEYRSGEVIWGVVPPSMRHHDDVARRVGLAVVDALGELHSVDPDAAGLGDLGRPDGFVERQVAGWTKRWGLARTEGAEPLMEVVGARLAEAMPRSPRASILHNDFKLDNCQFDPADPDRVRSIFDWDMATLGDPFVDLGTLLNYWPDPSDTEDDKPIMNPGMETMGLPTRGEVVERYAEVTGFDVGDVAWYEAFACWKTAVVLQQLYARYVRGESTDERMESRGAWVSDQAHRAMRILDERP